MRETRAQVVDAHSKMMRAKIEGKPFVSPGEYLGDVQIKQDELLKSLSNANESFNSIGRIPEGPYLLIADFDYEGDGHFIGMRLIPRTD